MILRYDVDFIQATTFFIKFYDPDAYVEENIIFKKEDIVINKF